MKISAYIITFNEEKHIRDCLHSLSFCDEIVVLDSNSTDKTADIVKTFARRKKNIKVRFKNSPFNGYVNQKNLAAKYTTNDWVINLDADERISEELRLSILELKNLPDHEVNTEVSGYSMNRKNFYVDTWVKYCGWYPDKKVRLVNKRHAKWKGQQLHEVLEVPHGKIAHLKGDIIHYTFSSISDHLRKIDSYTSIGANEYFEKGRKISLLMAYLRMVTTFFRSYIFKLGFLDGKTGFIISLMSAYHTWLKYLKLWYLNRK